MARRFVPSLHPRDRNGKFTNKAGGNKSKGSNRPSSRPSSNASRASRLTNAVTSGGVVKNFSRAKAAYEVYQDVGDVVGSGTKAVAWGATGNYVQAGLHGTKAATATYRLGRRAAVRLVDSSDIAQSKKHKFYGSLNKLDDRVQTIDNVATIGMFLTGSSIKTPRPISGMGRFTRTAGKKGGTNARDRAYKGMTGNTAAKRSWRGDYVITDAKRMTMGAKLRGTRGRTVNSGALVRR
jgi:hypothetical protein